MEEYRSGNLGRRTTRTVGGSSLPKGKIAVDFPPRIVIVVGESDVISRSIVSRFVSSGCKTAFCSTSSKDGAALSQTSGARFYPVKSLDEKSIDEVIDDVTRHWGCPDTLIINQGENSCCATELYDTRVIARLDDSDTRLRIIEMALKSGDSEAINLSDMATADKTARKINRIVVRERSERCGEIVSSLCVFICEPCGRFLAGQMFEVD